MPDLDDKVIRITRRRSLVLKRRTEPIKEFVELHDAVNALGADISKRVEPLLRWTHRQIRRWPWLYRKLG